MSENQIIEDSKRSYLDLDETPIYTWLSIIYPFWGITIMFRKSLILGLLMFLLGLFLFKPFYNFISIKTKIILPKLLITILEVILLSLLFYFTFLDYNTN